ncbi:MAG: polysaccharide pyruvyl transferase family protein [Clostridia bacterium]
MAKVCISGYYGYGSADHELVLMGLISALRRQDENMEIVVFSADPAKTEDEFDVNAVQRDQWEALKRELRSSDLLISGGGHLLKETADLQELKYYLKVIKSALRMKLPVFVYNQVLTPFTSSRAQNMAAHVLTKVRKITVADRQSADVLHSMGIRRGRIHVMEDPVLALTDVEAEWKLTDVAESEGKKVSVHKEKKEAKKEPVNYDGMDVEIEIRIVDKKETPAEKNDDLSNTIVADPALPGTGAETPAEPEGTAKTVEVQKETSEKQNEPEEAGDKIPKDVPNRPRNLALVVPAFWKKPGEKFAAFSVSPKPELPVSQITAMADYMIENGYQVVFLPVSYPDDAALCKEIAAMMKHPAYEVEGKMSPQSLYTAINEVDFVFTSEIYPMMLAAVCHKPFASLCCTERALDFVSALGLTPTGNLMHYDSEVFVRNFKTAVADPGAIVAAIGENLEELREKAAYGEEQLKLLFAQIERKKAREERSRARSSREGGASSVSLPSKEQLKGLISFGGKGKKKESLPEEDEFTEEPTEMPSAEENEMIDADFAEDMENEAETAEKEISEAKESE